jgi:uncharacterized protein DUF6325
VPARLAGKDFREGRHMRDLDEMGPVDYLVVEFPDGTLNGHGLDLLLGLVDQGTIRIIDLAFVRKDPTGSVAAVDIRDLDAGGEFDLTVFEGASSGILARDDIEASGAMIQPGHIAAVLVYENLWAAPLAVALRRAGGQLVANGRIPIQGILAALDAAEAAEAGTVDAAVVGTAAATAVPGKG